MISILRTSELVERKMFVAGKSIKTYAFIGVPDDGYGLFIGFRSEYDKTFAVISVAKPIHIVAAFRALSMLNHIKYMSDDILMLTYIVSMRSKSNNRTTNMMVDDLNKVSDYDMQAVHTRIMSEKLNSQQFKHLLSICEAKCDGLVSIDELEDELKVGTIDDTIELEQFIASQTNASKKQSLSLFNRLRDFLTR